jgi:hypothetical protein
MPVLDLTQITNKNVVEVTNNVTNTTVELNAGLVLPSPISTLEDLTDVTAGATPGQIIQWDGTAWVPVDNEGGIDIAATNGQILQYNGTEWVAVDLSAAGDDQIDADINVTDTTGNYTPGMTITAGTDFESIFRFMMESYQAPVASLGDWTTGTFEHGATFTEDGFTLSFSNDSNINTGVTGTYTFSDTYISGPSNTATAVDGPYTIPTINDTLLVTNTSAGVSTLSRSGAASFTVTGFEDTNGSAINTVSASSTVRFRYWILDSGSAINTTNSATLAYPMVVAADSSLNGTGGGVLESGLFSTDSQLGMTMPGSHDYVYWCFPAAAEISNVVMNGSINLYAGDKADQTTAVIHCGEFDLINQFGQSVRMELLRSKVSNAFAAGTVITVS